ncbi:hypothetical protein [Amycolatopsis sp. cmx-8-4]|uniref:hypothetical protein n=1 Tax=Amycolatopsis sp. cmx-8-4 TaxID=2790947 RepID=UPI00397BA08B
MSIRNGEVRFEKLDFADTDVDFADLDDGWGSEKTGFPRLVFEGVRFLRCRLRLEQMSDRDRERMVWFRDCVLDTVTVSLADLPGARPWLNLRDVELRGGSEIPERYVRHSAQQRLDH